MYLYAPAEPQQSSSTEAELNGEGRLKAVPGPAASVFNHRSLCTPTPHTTPPPPPTLLSLHADQAAVKGAMHPATPTRERTDRAVVTPGFRSSPINPNRSIGRSSSSAIVFGQRLIIGCSIYLLSLSAPSQHLIWMNRFCQYRPIIQWEYVAGAFSWIS